MPNMNVHLVWSLFLLRFFEQWCFKKKKEAYLFSLNFQNLLFTPPPSKTFSRGQGIVGQDLDLYIDCFVSCFRITPHNNDVLKICLNPHSPPIYHFVLVNALHRIITQVLIVSDVYIFLNCVLNRVRMCNF